MSNEVVPPCHVAPRDKKAMISAVGQELVRRHGKKKYYKPAEVRSAANSCGYGNDVHCWAYSIYITPEDFIELHRLTGEACDYAVMKAQVLSDLATSGSFLPLDLDLSWLEWPDIDVSCLFDWFDFTA